MPTTHGDRAPSPQQLGREVPGLAVQEAPEHRPSSLIAFSELEQMEGGGLFLSVFQRALVWEITV